MNGPDKGHVVYFFVAGRFVKVGYSRNVWERLRDLQTGNPVEVVIAHTIGYPTEETARLGEKKWRAELLAVGRPAMGEWVELDPYIRPKRTGPFLVIPIAEFMLRPHPTTRELLAEGLRKWGLSAELTP